MAFGYIGKILHVDLTNRKIDVEEKDDIFYRSHLGGRGIGYHYLLKNVPSGVDPFSPENVLVFATGVMTGAPIAASCRFSVVAKSPLTGTASSSSGCSKANRAKEAAALVLSLTVPSRLVSPKPGDSGPRTSLRHCQYITPLQPHIREVQFQTR